MRLGFLTGSVSRKAGGLFPAVRSLAEALQRSPEIDLNVFGLMDADTAADLPAWGPVPVNASPVRGPRGFGYASGLGSELGRKRIDLLHVHGMWMYPSIAARRWSARTRAPYVISPHGMLDRWAIKNSRWKKRIAILLYEGSHLHGAACLHALCEAEAQDIRAFGLTNPICIIPNGTEVAAGLEPPPAPWRAELARDAKVLLYLGRLHPKKGLLNLLRAMHEVHRCADEQPRSWHLVIAGWDQNGHRAHLEAFAAQCGMAGFVHFVGPQYGDAKLATLCAADAFVLPSVSEGLPMAVLEAWTHGLPVLMTPQCNLPEGFAAGAAIRIECDPESIASGLQELFSMGENGLHAMGKAGVKLAAKDFSWAGIAERMEAVYRWLLGIGPRPDCAILN